MSKTVALSLCVFACLIVLTTWAALFGHGGAQQPYDGKGIPGAPPIAQRHSPPSVSDPWKIWPPLLQYAPCRPRIYIYPINEKTEPFPGEGVAGIEKCIGPGTQISYYSEVYLWKFLQQEPYRSLYVTSDPQNATHFFVPFFGSCWMFRSCWKPSRECNVSSYVDRLIDSLEFFPRYPERHIFIHSMDARTDYYKKANRHKDFASAISLVTNGERSAWTSSFRLKRDIVIPSTTHPMVTGLKPTDFLPSDGGDFLSRPEELVFYGGIGKETDSYSKGIRGYIKNLFSNVSGWNIGKPLSHKEYGQRLASAKFGLSPEGWTLDTTRTWEFLAFGVVPVVIADGIVQAFEDDIDWRTASVIVQRRDVKLLPEILRSIPKEVLLERHKYIWNHARFALIEQEGCWHYIARALCRCSNIRQPTVLPFDPANFTWRDYAWGYKW